MKISTTELSVKGQVVIPEEIRRRAGLEPGDRFVVVSDADAILLQRLSAPDEERLAGLREKAHAMLSPSSGDVLDVDPRELDRVCRRHQITRLSLFGSRAHGAETASSDVDLLIEFEDGKKPGLGFFAAERELSELLGRPVDLNTPEFLSEAFRSDVIGQAVEIYVRP